MSTGIGAREIFVGMYRAGAGARAPPQASDLPVPIGWVCLGLLRGRGQFVVRQSGSWQGGRGGCRELVRNVDALGTDSDIPSPEQATKNCDQSERHPPDPLAPVPEAQNGRLDGDPGD